MNKTDPQLLTNFLKWLNKNDMKVCVLYSHTEDDLWIPIDGHKWLIDTYLEESKSETKAFSNLSGLGPNYWDQR